MTSREHLRQSVGADRIAQPADVRDDRHFALHSQTTLDQILDARVEVEIRRDVHAIACGALENVIADLFFLADERGPEPGDFELSQGSPGVKCVGLRGGIFADAGEGSGGDVFQGDLLLGEQLRGQGIGAVRGVLPGEIQER